MIDPKKIEQFANQIVESMPSGVKAMADNAEEKFKTVLQNKLSQLDVVSREEFDIQTQVLARTRAKLEALETELADIKASLAAKD